MNFSDLPLYIQHDIIYITVAMTPKYCIISKEWLQYIAIEFGKLEFTGYSVCIKYTPKPGKFYVSYVPDIFISSCENFNWELIYSMESIKEIHIDFAGNVSRDNSNNILSKMMPFQSLESLFLYSESDVSMCLGQILERNHCSIKKVYIFSKFEAYRVIFDKIKFSKLTHLYVALSGHCISTQSILNNFPSLEHLYLCFDSYDDVLFDSAEMAKLTCLDLIYCTTSDKLVKVNLTTLPKIKELYVDERLKLDGTSAEFIKTLKLGGSLKSISNVLENQFSNLVKLKLDIDTCENNTNFTLFMNCNLPNVEFLEIKWSDRTEFELKVSLVKLPSLKVLKTYEKLEFVDEVANDTIEKLKISDDTNSLSDVISYQFTNLKRVHLYIQEQSHDDKMNKLFKCFKELTKLSLDFFRQSNLLQALPPGPYSITHLTLKGQFILTSPQLTWFSHHLPHLAKLKLHWYNFQGDLPSSTLPFPNLQHLIINTHTRHLSDIEAHFNSKNYHGIKLDILECNCWYCGLKGEQS